MVKGADVSSRIIDKGNRFTGEAACEPYTKVPAWWSGFLFHVLTPRQVSMYLYLSMLTDEYGICNPKIDRIRQDLGLASPTVVFEAIGVLEDLGFFLKRRIAVPNGRSRRNIYQRASCEYTVLRLLETGRVDGEMRTSRQRTAKMNAEVLEGLRELVEPAAFTTYSKAAGPKKKGLLLEALIARLSQAREDAK
jgi:hypothetical protein